MKFSLIALHLAAVLQFLETSNYTNKKFVAEDGSTVNVYSNGVPRIDFSSSSDKEGKKKFTVNIGVPTGAGLFDPQIVAFDTNETRDIVTALIKAGLAYVPEIAATPVIVVPDEA